MTSRRWLFVGLGTFVVAGGVYVSVFGATHSKTPFCTVAWDAWTTIDKYRAHRLNYDDAIRRLDQDVSSMKFHVDALKRQGNRKEVSLANVVIEDVSQAKGVIESGADPHFGHYAIEDLVHTALFNAGCWGPRVRV